MEYFLQIIHFNRVFRKYSSPFSTVNEAMTYDISLDQVKILSNSETVRGSSHTGGS